MMANDRRPGGYVIMMTVVFLLVTAAASLPDQSAASLEMAETAVPQPTLEPPTQQIIVQYEGENGHFAPYSSQQMQTLRGATGVELTYFREMSGDAHVLRLPAPLPVAEVEAIARQIAALPGVVYAEPDRVMTLAFTPNDPEYANQWHYYQANGVNAPTAWDITTGSANVRIAVLDSGITEHVDLNGRWLGGYDFISNVAWANDGDGRDPDPSDPGDWVEGNECFPGSQPRHSSWHGTHVAGTIGASTHNGLGVAGLNWHATIVPVRVVGKCGGFISDVADGMRWAAGLNVSGVPDNPHPAQLLNLSVGGPGVCSPTYQNAINAINAIGGIIVVAAGNNSANLNTNSYQPANCADVISVAATNRSGSRAIYSNYGAVVKISAPGGETQPVLSNGVLSTSNSGLMGPVANAYRYSQGTSMAAPHVTGVISLLLAVDPALTLTQVIQLLQNTARPFPAGSNCTISTCGSGIVDAGAALNALPTPPTTTPTATNTPLPPTATYTPLPPTATNTPLPPTATYTPLPPTATYTPLPPTATNTPPPPTATNTPLPPTATYTPLPPTATNTSLPPTATNTPLQPTATHTPLPTATQTPSPPTATYTPLPPTATNTPLPPTATNTPLPPTATYTPLPPTATNTPLPPTATYTPLPPTATNTPLPPTATNTSLPPTATNTSLPPTATNTPTATYTPLPPTATNTPPPPTATNTPLPPTATYTPLPPTATNTSLPPTATNTPLPPTATYTPLPPTATNTPLPPTATQTPSPPTTTYTPIPPTMTNTPSSLPPTHTHTPIPSPTATDTPLPSPTATSTLPPATTTATPTPYPPSATPSPLPPTATNTPESPTATATMQPISSDYLIYLPLVTLP